MSEPDELGERVTRLEGEVALARQDAAAARVLAGGADRDVAAMQSELRAHTRSLNALRETQREQGDRIDRLDRKVGEGFAKVEERFAMVETEMREGFSVLAVGQAQITALLTGQLGEPGETD
jgi:hypothetical protein